MDNRKIINILKELQFFHEVLFIKPFCREENGTPYEVWKIETDSITVVLKKVSQEERATLEAFFPCGGCGTPKIYGFIENEGETYLLMDFFEGETMSQSTHNKLTLALDALIEMQMKFWNNADLTDVGWTFEKRHAARKKRRVLL